VKRYLHLCGKDDCLTLSQGSFKTIVLFGRASLIASELIFAKGLFGRALSGFGSSL
jgi:hypothetical protein